MKIPKYVIDLMNRARYNYTADGDNYAVGYTIDIAKYSHYETAKATTTETVTLIAASTGYAVITAVRTLKK